MTIGEEVNKIDEVLKSEFNNIPWNSIKGLRNRIAHDYRGTDPTIPFNVISHNLVDLKVALVKMINRIDYPASKLNKVLESRFYKNLSYLKK